jgi:hypothetical protein
MCTAISEGIAAKLISDCGNVLDSRLGPCFSPDFPYNKFNKLRTCSVDKVLKLVPFIPQSPYKTDNPVFKQVFHLSVPQQISHHG